MNEFNFFFFKKLRIPRPILTLPTPPIGHQQENRRNELILDLDMSSSAGTQTAPSPADSRSSSPAHFTLLSQSGIIPAWREVAIEDEKRGGKKSKKGGKGSKMDKSAGGTTANSSALKSPSTWQLAFSVCAFLLLALVAMIIYMEGNHLSLSGDFGDSSCAEILEGFSVQLFKVLM